MRDETAPRSDAVSGEKWVPPALGPRGEGWAALQTILLLWAAAAGLTGRPWPVGMKRWLAVAGLCLAPVGIVLLLGGSLQLGRQLTPYPKPVPAGTLRGAGLYASARHPIYGGVLLLLLSWSLLTSPTALVTWTAGAGFLEVKRRREEVWLRADHPEYAAYQRRVRRRFIPYVW